MREREKWKHRWLRENRKNTVVNSKAKVRESVRKYVRERERECA